MVRPIPIPNSSHTLSAIAIPLAIGLFVSVSLLVGLCAKHARQMTRKHNCKGTHNPSTPSKAKAPLPSPKQLIASISHKAMSPLINGKKSSAAAAAEEENGVWQKAIMMGERCEPPQFSGVIYYDYDGNRIPQMPKSPRHGSMTPLKNLNFPSQKSDNSLY